MVSGGDDTETVREALKKALAGLPLDPGQSDALKRYLQDAGKSAPNAAGGGCYLPGWYMPINRGQDWIGNPENAYMATGALARSRDWLGNHENVDAATGAVKNVYETRGGYARVGCDPARVAVGGLAPFLLGAGAYAALDGYKHGFPHVATTLLGHQYGPKLVDLTHRVTTALTPVTTGAFYGGRYGVPPAGTPTRMRSGADESGYGWRGWYGRPPMNMPSYMRSGYEHGSYGRPSAGLPQRMRAGIDTSTQMRADLPSPLVESLAASMRRSVA
jgi:hypothetical protein